MIKHQVFVNKHLPVQTQRKENISKRYSIYSNLLKSYYSNATDIIIVLLLSLFDMTLVCTSLVLLFIPLAKWYNKQRFKAQQCTLSKNFL